MISRSDCLRWLYNRVKRNPALRRRLTQRLPVFEQEVAGLHLFLHPADNRTDRMLWLTGRFPEQASLDRLKEVATRPRSLVIDIGANMGSFTLPLAETLSPGSRLIAIEPNPTMFARLQRNLDANGLSDRVELLPVALSDTTGRAVLARHGRNYGQSTLGTLSHERYLKDTIDVQTVELADLLPASDSYDRLVIKIDVEGFEDKVLWSLLGRSEPPVIDCLLIETKHESDWNMPLRDRILSSGLEPVFEGNGNTMFVRRTVA